MDEDFESSIKVISFILQEAAHQNELISRQTLTISRFHTLVPPKITIHDYLKVLNEKTKCGKTCFISAMIYIDRLLTFQPTILITPTTVHKLFLIALLTASKFLTDVFYNNQVWALIGGVRTEEINILEREFLFMLEFSLVISKEEYEHYEKLLDNIANCRAFLSPTL